MQGIIIQAISMIVLLSGYLVGIFLGIPRTVRAYTTWRQNMQEKHFGYFVNDLTMTLFMLSAPSIVLIKKLYLIIG